ncbi:hypothetical protein DAEQUDRAFT_168979 [Daedalea quercina L-15889]|uniref:Nuclear transport factor 2 domain-containing protein n=1 Tax=Daedalea quercina L-15889 TaxID=1314783 RepID=A0A165RJU3_9APHY|nr:hypothetical protein DAEQUDRAFT_168979 [Daedalea quercina L-15889]
MVKRERSPSPTIRFGPEPITEGAVRYAPMPIKCRKGHPGFQTNRRIWAEDEKRRLWQRNIEPTRVFIRDDGMVIDWKSPIPVMPDTLLPPIPMNVPPTQPRPQESPEVIDLDGSDRHTPRSQSSAHRSSRSSSRPSVPMTEIIDVDTLDVPTEPPISVAKGVVYKPLPPRNTPNSLYQLSQTTSWNQRSTSVASQSISDLLQDVTGTPPPPLSEEEGELQCNALTFLQKYIRLFDRDRAALVSAYSHVATFSVTTHDPSHPTSRPSPRTSAQRVRQGRAGVAAGLLALPAGRRFLPSGPRDVNYDVVCLENTTDVLLICYAGETKDDDGKVWACDQRFVLRKKDWDANDQYIAGAWPLVAVSHQMTIREKIPPLPRPITF